METTTKQPEQSEQEQPERKGSAVQEGGERTEVEQTSEADKRSIYVKNVEYKCSKEDVLEHFKSCGKISRVTIVNDKFTGHPKGCCYVEFAEPASVENAILLSNSILKGREIQVYPKRTNLPDRSRGYPPARGGRGGRGGFNPGYRGGRGGGFNYRGGRGFASRPGIPGGRRDFHPYS